MKCPRCGIENKFHIRNIHGYILVPTPKGHPHKVDYIFEHILVAEKKIGRYLTEGESVHHLDKVRDNNDPNNLVVVTDDDHSWYHKHTKKKTKK